MEMEKFISENDVDHSKDLIDVGLLEQAEKTVGMRFGGELTEYLLKYGFLGYGFVELYGINSRQGLESDMVTQTLYLHRYFPATMGFVALENQGEGDYYIVNSNDEVFAYDASLKELTKTSLSLFEYIQQRFEAVG